MTMIKPAHADGQVDTIYVYTINSGGFNNGCFGKASVAEAMQCEVDFENSFLDGDYAQIASWGGYDIAICPRAVAHDLNTSNPNLYFFKVSPLYRLFAYMPPNPKIAVCTGGGETSSSINVIPSSCPSNTNAGFPCTCKTGYKPDPTQTSCVPAACPAHASGTPCACETGYKFDAAGTSCVPAAVCPVDKLTTPPFSDACSTSLEQGKGVDVNNDCGTLRKPDMVEAASCIAAKIHALNIPYTQPSATIRTTAYQNHLLEIWTKSQELDTIMNSVVYTQEIKQACAPTNVDVNNEKAQHHIKYQPSSSGDSAPHVEHRAIDVPEAVIKALKDQVTTYTTTVTIINGQKKTMKTITSNVEDYMHSAPNACNPNLRWGGTFTPKDSVHFQLP